MEGKLKERRGNERREVERTLKEKEEESKGQKRGERKRRGEESMWQHLCLMVRAVDTSCSWVSVRPPCPMRHSQAGRFQTDPRSVKLHQLWREPKVLPAQLSLKKAFQLCHGNDRPHPEQHSHAIKPLYQKSMVLQ